MMRSKKLTFTVEEALRKMEQYCVYQDRCHQEVERKLKQMGMINEACEKILLHLLEHDFLNEERFARSYTLVESLESKTGEKEESEQELTRERNFMLI